MPAAAVIPERLALFGVTGRQGWVGKFWNRRSKYIKVEGRIFLKTRVILEIGGCHG